jgi:hypothetical protein
MSARDGTRPATRSTRRRTRRSTRRSTRRWWPLALAALVVATLAACSGDDNPDAAGRNSSNFNTRSIVAFGREVPTMPGADVVTRGAVEAGAWHKTYEVPADLPEVLAFHQRELPGSGWTEGGTPSTTPGGIEATWRRRGLRLDLTIAPATSGTSTGGSSTATPPTSAGDSPRSTVNLSVERTTTR